MSIPDAAIEAAAEALARRNWGDTLNANDYSREARAAIEAAMPAIREALAQEIEEFAKAEWGDMGGSSYHTYLHAASIVRGDTP